MQLHNIITGNQFEENITTVPGSSKEISAVYQPMNPEVPGSASKLYSSHHGPPIPISHSVISENVRI